MQQQIEMQFQWKRHETKEVIVAVTKAVILGYNTKDKLLAVLPMFSTYRIALAIDALITADMAENNFGVLCIHQTCRSCSSCSSASLCCPCLKNRPSRLQFAVT